MNKILLCVIALVALFYSCEEETYERISRDDWTKLQVGDTLYFRSSAHVDTFFIRSITNDYNTSEKVNHTESLTIYYDKVTSENQLDTVYISWYGIERYPKSSRIQWKRFRGYSSEDNSDTTLIISDIKVTEIVVIPEFTKNTCMPTDTKTVFYCNRYGVIQYELYNGEIFTIDRNCLQRLTERAEQ